MENKVAIAGKLVNDATQTMPIYGIEGLYAVEVEVIRTSGVIDKLQCIFNIDAVDIGSNEDLKIHRLRSGSDVIVYGAVQTYRDEKGHTPLFMWVEYITIGQAVNQNHVKLEGIVHREPVHRFTPLGREITDLMLKVQCTVAINETQCEMNVKRHCYIPCITWGRSAKFAEQRLCKTWRG